MPAYGPRQKVETTETHQTGGHLDEGMSLQLLKSQSRLGNKSTRPSSAASSPSPKGGRIDASEKASSTTTLGNLLPFGATDSSPTSPVIMDAHLSKDDGDQKKKAPSTHEEGKQLYSSGIFLFCFRVCRPISCSCTATGGAMKDTPLKKVEETTETQNQPGDIRQLFKSPQSPLGNESTRPSTKTEEKDGEAEGDATQGSTDGVPVELPVEAGLPDGVPVGLPDGEEDDSSIASSSIDSLSSAEFNEVFNAEEVLHHEADEIEDYGVDELAEAMESLVVRSPLSLT